MSMKTVVTFEVQGFVCRKDGKPGRIWDIVE